MLGDLLSANFIALTAKAELFIGEWHHKDDFRF
jgi:hypothetical protein